MRGIATGTPTLKAVSEYTLGPEEFDGDMKLKDTDQITNIIAWNLQRFALVKPRGASIGLRIELEARAE